MLQERAFGQKDHVILVTGGAGFLGSNVVRCLNREGNCNVVVVDNYDDNKFNNLRGLYFVDYISYKKGFVQLDESLSRYKISAVIHIGANANVLSNSSDDMLEVNYEFSKFYMSLASINQVPFIYASSSAVYGHNALSADESASYRPHNVYAWSKWLFDRFVESNLSSFSSRVVGLRLFNMFGNGESHKGLNASIPFRFASFLLEKGFIDLFDVDIQRDYVWVDDVSRIILDVLHDNSIPNGIYDVGGGNPISHLQVAEMVAEEFAVVNNIALPDSLIQKIQVPEQLNGALQTYTCATNILEPIRRHSKNNKEKMKEYIKQLFVNLPHAG